jgi:hypothetical protein
VISDEKKEEVLSRIREIENFIISDDDGAIDIGARCSRITAESAELATSSDSLKPVLRTSLVINWRESAMRSRYERFVKTFPEISTLSALKRIMDRTEPLDFCKTYLNINANSSAADKNPKYCLLKELTDGFLEYQELHSHPSEIEAIRHWSEKVKLDDLKNDYIGKRHGVGPAVVGNIRLNLGERVVKLDRHVIGVMKKFLRLEDISLNRYDEFARYMGRDPRYWDCILFKYGQAKNISA